MRLRLKILIPVVALLLALGGGFAYFVIGSSSNHLVASQDEHALTLIPVVTGMLVNDRGDIDTDGFGERLRNAKLLGESSLVYIVVYTLKGQSVVVSGKRGVPAGASDFYEWIDPLDAPPIRRTNNDPEFADIVEFLAPVSGSGKGLGPRLLGSVKLGFSYQSAIGQKNRILFHVAVLGTLILFAGIAIATYLAKSITEPLEAIVDGIDAVGRGEMGRRIDVASADEIGALGAAFNQMAERLRQSRVKIENYSRDLEEMVRARTAELRRAYEELKRLDELKDTFLSSVSHELRTPLTSIHSFVEILLQYADEDPATRQEFLGIIKRETERLSRLIDDVLDLAKIEAGMATWKVDRHDLRGIIEDAIAAIRPLYDAAKLQFHFSYPPRIPQVLCDRDRLSQVITNLLSNARKFTQAGDTVEIRLKIENGFLRAEFEDHGVGISPENCEKVFEKFRQIENEHLTDKPKGTGLGLPISRDIIEFHGGKMWVESEVGKGSTFIFTIPTADNPEPRPIQKYVESEVGA